MNENPVKNYNYDTAGNLVEKGDLDLEYNDTEHVHAVTDAGSNAYDYDENGNQTHRLVHTLVNGQPVTQEFEMGYDAENRLVSVTGVNGTTMSTLFTYNGDGQKVKSVVNGETVYLVNGYYEKKGSEITKYYPGGAMRKYTIPQSMNVEYVLGDHLGSSSVMTDTDGNKVSEMRYSPWGEVRYHWVDPALSTTPAYKLPTKTFTGQYSYMDDPSTQSAIEGFGLMFYQSRFYDPQVGRFSQADSIVPGGVQGLDRYAYVNNSPLNYLDPSGHRPISFIPVFIRVGLATSGIPENHYGGYPAPAQVRYISKDTVVLPEEYWNLCGDISLSIILEAATGGRDTLTSVFGARPTYLLKDVPTLASEVAATVMASNSPFHKWKADAVVWATYIKSAEDLANTLADMLHQGHYLVVGVTQDSGGPNLVNRGVGDSVWHWVVVYGVDGNYIYIVNPYSNARQKYSWDEFYQSWTWDWVELTPPSDLPVHERKHRGMDEE